MENSKISQEELYFRLYMTFNDDNREHCENSFLSHGYHQATESVIKKANILFILEIISHGCAAEEIIKEVPEAEELVKEAIQKNESK